MKQILIVEDDSFLNKMLAYNLTGNNQESDQILGYEAGTVALYYKAFCGRCLAAENQSDVFHVRVSQDSKRYLR